MSTEDRWTGSTAWCPAPQHWHSHPTIQDVTEDEVTALVLALVVALQPETVVETGTSTGATALAIGTALQANGHGHLHTVEIDPALAHAAHTLTARLPVTVVCGDSLAWDGPDDPIDFAWIDSGPAAVRVQEIVRWREKFRPGAVIGVHDTAPTHGREVLHDLLERTCRDLGWPQLNLRTPRGVSLVQVPW